MLREGPGPLAEKSCPSRLLALAPYDLTGCPQSPRERWPWSSETPGHCWPLREERRHERPLQCVVGGGRPWHPQCPGDLPVLPTPAPPPASSMWPCLSQTHFLLKHEGTPSWQPHVLIWGDAPSSHGRSVLWSWEKSLEVVEPGWPALIPKPGVLGPRKFWLLAILPPHPPVQAQGSRGVLPRTPVFRGGNTCFQYSGSTLVKGRGKNEEN